MKLEANLMTESQGDKESMEGIDAFLEKENQIFQNLDHKFGILFALDMNEINKNLLY